MSQQVEMRSANVNGDAPGQGPISTTPSQEINSVNQTQWAYNKDHLMLIKAPDDRFVLVKDKPNGINGAKNYRWFKDIQTMIDLLENTKHESPNFYELYLNTTDYPCFIFFDIDRDLYPNVDEDIIDNLAPFFEKMLPLLLVKVQATLLRVYNIHFDPIIGTNTHVSYSLSEVKISAHIRINIKCKNLEVLKSFCTNLNNLIMSNTYTTSDERKYLTYTKQTNDHHYLTTIVDASVIKNFSHFKIVYSKKLGCPSPALLPYKNSSKLIKDHMVMCYPETLPPDASSIPEINDILEFEPPVDFSKINQGSIDMHVTQTRKDTPNHSIHQIMNGIPYTTIERVQHLLSTSQHVHQILNSTDIRFKYNQNTSEYTYSFALDKSMKYTCPLAKRVHKHNRSFFEYHHIKKVAYYNCFNEQCRKHATNKYTFKISLEHDNLSLIASTNNKTLHCKQDIIQWDEVYNAPIMKPYPLLPVTCIRANMGVGKTKALVEHYLPSYANDPQTKILFITYSRTLSMKYAHELKAFGFVNYLDREKSECITDNKSIVCLDSLCKIRTKDFDFIIIDEITSVLLHFNSKHMARCTEINAWFEYLLTFAKHIVVLDACVDNTIVYDVMEHIAARKHTKPYYIRNTFIRESNRNATILRNTKQSLTAAFKTTIFDYVIERLAENKRVVVTSSTKGFVEELTAYIKESKKVTNKRIIFYHSGNNDVKKSQSEQFYKDIKQCDAMIYSPTITSGVSIEFPHFDELVSYVENSFFTPPIDIVLQQMFRVRNLNNGNMMIFVNDTIKDEIKTNKFPINRNEIDRMLDEDIGLYNRVYSMNKDLYQTQKIMDMKKHELVYDKQLLSYKILRGIITNRNKSLKYFTQILVSTLMTDYKISCKMCEYNATETTIIKAAKTLRHLKSMNSQAVFPFSRANILTENAYKDLCVRQKKGDKLTDLEQHQKWLYHCAFDLWKMYPDKIDEDFFNTYIRQAKSSEIKKSVQSYLQLSRMCEMMHRSIDNHEKTLRSALNTIVNQGEYNIELYKTKVKRYYIHLIEGHKFLDAVCQGMDYKSKLADAGKVVVEFDKFHENVHAYFSKLNKDEYQNLVDTFDTTKVFGSVEDVIASTRKTTYFAERILYEAFGIEIESLGQKTALEHIKILKSDYKTIKEKYNPGALTMMTEEMLEQLFVGEGDDDIDTF
jgi:hypothetical protein